MVDNYPDDKRHLEDKSVEDKDGGYASNKSSSIKQQTQDHDTPFSEPSDTVGDTARDIDSRGRGNKLDSTHQLTDSGTNIDSHELYDEGLSGAVEADEPNHAGNVVDYHPSPDESYEED